MTAVTSRASIDTMKPNDHAHNSEGVEHSAPAVPQDQAEAITIYEVTQFTDGGQRGIQRLVPVAGGDAIYRSKGIRTQGPDRATFDFKIDAASVQEAFEKHDEALAVAGEKVGKHLAAERLKKELTAAGPINDFRARRASRHRLPPSV